MTDDLKRNAPVVTGELRRKTGVGDIRESTQRVTAEAVIDVSYGGYVVMGTRPHVITAKRNVLAFAWPKRGPGTFFFRSVNHPGTQPNSFFYDIVRRFGDYL
jgi:hypothetical protein